MSLWRLIVNGAGSGAWNMAIDRAILDAYERGDSGPTLRLYGWSLPTVSLGRFQPITDVSRAACDVHGVEICRRPTGGRGVLHDDEITYSIVTGPRDGLPRGTSASYRTLCSALVEAYRALGIKAELTSRNRGPSGSGACYLHATPADLSLGAAKLSGSAQVWSKDACLQHGSFVISRDVGRECEVFGLGATKRRALEESTSTMEAALGGRPSREDVMRCILEGIERGLGVELQPGPLSGDESRQAESLVTQFETRW